MSMSNSTGSRGIRIYSTSNAIEIVQGEAKYYLLLYECYSSLIPWLLVLSLANSTPNS